MDARILDLASQLVDFGIPVSLLKNSVSIESGFYKSDGCVYLVIEDDEVVLKSRYDSSKTVELLRDIVAESYDWYDYSKDRHDGWELPAPGWDKLYDMFGYNLEKSPEQQLKEALEENKKLKEAIAKLNEITND